MIQLMSIRGAPLRAVQMPIVLQSIRSATGAARVCTDRNLQTSLSAHIELGEGNSMTTTSHKEKAAAKAEALAVKTFARKRFREGDER